MQTELSKYTAIIGIDWADKKHDVCVYVTATGKQKLSQVPHQIREDRRVGAITLPAIRWPDGGRC